MLSCAIVYVPHREVDQLTPYSMIYLGNRNRSSARQDIPDIYANGSFLSVSTRASHLSLSRAKWIESMPSHPIHLRSLLILSSHLRMLKLSLLLLGLHISAVMQTTIGQCPLPSVSYFSITIVVTSVVLCLAKIMFMAFSSVNIWKVFLAKSCPYGSVALRNISVHGLATTQCCEPKHRASCILHRIHLNNVTGVTTWGTLTMFQTWCPSPLTLTISQVPGQIQSFLQELWH